MNSDPHPSSSDPHAAASPDAVNGRILLVEDDDDAVVLIQHLLKRAGIHHPLDVVNDGQQAIDFLQAHLEAGTPPPKLILLDLKLPKKSGFDVLAWMQSDERLQKVRVVVMSSSTRLQDMQRARELGASSYLEKYPSVTDLPSIFQWSSYLSLPREISNLRISEH